MMQSPADSIVENEYEVNGQKWNDLIKSDLYIDYEKAVNDELKVSE